MSTASDQRVLLQRNARVSNVLLQSDPEYFLALVRVLEDFLRRNAADVERQTPLATATSAEIQQAWNDVVSQIVGAVTESTPVEETHTTPTPVPKAYTEEELALYFGVHADTMSRWISEGRFGGVQRKGRSKPPLIPETANFRTYSQTLLAVQWVVERYHQERQMANAKEQMSRAEQMEALRQEINDYEALYGGAYEETIGVLPSLTHAQENDAELWRYFSKRLAELEGAVA